MKIKGAIFDMDGLLLNTEILYQKFWCQSARLFGYPMENRHVLAIRSTSGAVTEKILKGFFGESFDCEKVKEKRIELMEEYIDKNELEPKKGGRELLTFLKGAGVKTAVASTSPYPRVEKYLKETGLFTFFDSFTTGEMVSVSKPAPDIYLLACRRLGLNPAEAAAFEDSPNGIISAKTAGCNTVMIPDLSLPDEELAPYIDECFESLDKAIPFLKNKLSPPGES